METTTEATMIQVDATTRAGRMIEAGRVTVTFRSPTTGSHITLTAKCRAPKAEGQGWEGTGLAQAKVIFIEVPSQGGFNDKVGKITRARGFVADPRADKARVWCAGQLLKFLAGQPLAEGLEAMEESACGRCGRALTDPISIERGIGPECYGMITGSQHEVKQPNTAAQVTLHDADPENGPNANAAEADYLAHQATAPAQTLEDATAGVSRASAQDAQRTRTGRHDGRDRNGVAYGHGDWRQRKEVANEAARERAGQRTEESPAWCQQIQTLPGTTWEDIFRPAAEAKGIVI